MRRLVLAIFVCLLFSGCASTRAPEPDDRSIPGLPAEYTKDHPRLLCLDGSNLTIFGEWPRGGSGCNVNMTPTNLGNEVTIAVNPKDWRNVVGGAKDYTKPAAGDCVWDGIYTTKDGGLSWTNQQLPGSPWKRLSDPSEPVTPLTKHWCATDPVVSFAPDGTVYYSAMGYQCDPVTGSPTGAGTIPETPVGGGGLNDWAFNCVQMFVLRSTDGGLTWPTVVPLDPAGSYPVSFNDRQWLHVNPLNGHVYVGWVVFHGVTVENWFYRSEDGLRYEGPTIVSTSETAGVRHPDPSKGGQGTMITSGPDGRVYMSWTCGAVTKLVVSTDDGRTFGTPIDVPTRCENRRVLYPSAEYSRGEPRTPDAPFPAADWSDGPHRGNLYFVTRTNAFDAQGADIGFLRSSDEGRTWSKLKQLNDPQVAKEAHQFFPAVSVNPHGVIDVVWYDQRNDPEHRKLDLYYTYSLDGGETWAPESRVTEVMTEVEPSRHQNGMVFIGDYIDIDSSERFAHPVWVDTRNGEADVYTAWIERPAYPIGHPARAQG